MHGFKIEIWLQFVFDAKCSAVKPCCSEHKVIFVKMPMLHVKAFDNFCRAWIDFIICIYFFKSSLGVRQVFIPSPECVVLSRNCVLSKIVENIKTPYQWEYCVHRLKALTSLFCMSSKDSSNHHHKLLPGKAPGEWGWPSERPERKSSLYQSWCTKWWVRVSGMDFFFFCSLTNCTNYQKWNGFA